VTENIQSNAVHEATAAALGFYFQSQFALLKLISQTSSDAAAVVERMDDVELRVDGQQLLYQLKHSIQKDPPPVTLASVAFWKTIKVWIDALPFVSLADTTFHLVAVGKVPADSPLMSLCDSGIEREALLKAMEEEADRVLSERADAKSAGTKLPHAARAPGCLAFHALSPSARLSLLRRVIIQQDTASIGEMPNEVAKRLHLIPKVQRLEAAKRLLQWWDQQVIFSLCEKRDRVIHRSEMEHQISSIIADIDNGTLVAEFSEFTQPDDYEPDGLLTRQIALVNGRPSDIAKAIRAQWRAKEQRSSWITNNPEMRSKIAGYDTVLTERWSDRHTQMVEDCAELEPAQVAHKGLELLRWTHENAPTQVEPIARGWTAHYYVQGTFQVLAIDLRVGWHANYMKLLKD
jgi:hypothetical protein